jgi:hypothetical protein
MNVIHRTLMEDIAVTNDFKPKRPIGLFTILASSLALAACSTSPADAASSTPERMAEVEQVCGHTMRLSAADTDYDMCVRSLLMTLSGMDQAKLVQRDRQVCMQRGLKPGSSDFAVCVVDAETPINN